MTSAGVPGFSLRVESVSLSFGSVAVLRDVDFAVTAGEVVGVLGSNGSGKTTLLNCISGAYKVDTGRILLGDRIISTLPAHKVTRVGFARSFQGLELPRNLRCVDAVMLGRHCHLRGWGVAAYSVGLPYRLGAEHRSRLLAEAALDRVGCLRWRHEYLGDVPYGVAKRIDIARTLVAEPKVLLLDEPAAGLSHLEREGLSELVSSLSSPDMAVLVIEHDMSFISRVASRCITLSSGRIVSDEEMPARPGS